MSRLACVVVAVLGSAFLLPVGGWAQMQGVPDPAGVPDQLAGQFHEATYEALRLASRPGEKHKALAPMVGDWYTTITSWSAPGAEPRVAEGTASFQWEMDGRFLVERAEGTVRGETYRSLSFIGFDNVSKRYQWSRIDNLSSAIQSFEGELAAAD